MMLAKLVHFDRPLSGVSVEGQSSKSYTEAEIAAIRQEAYQKGQDAALSFSNRELVEFRSDMQNLQEGILDKLNGIDTRLLDQLREQMPALVMDLAKRLFAGYEPSPEVLEKIACEALDQLFPERENLELILSAQDHAILDSLNPEWLKRYPGLKVRVDAAMVPGDCQVRSRFGLTDARRSTKLETLSLGLTGS